jgi:hypothetical protein
MIDSDLKRQGIELLRKLAFCKQDSKYVYKARIAFAGALIKEGRRDEGMALLRNFPESAGSYRDVALTYAKAYDEAQKNAERQKQKEK